MGFDLVMFLELHERIGKREEKHSFEASISDSNAASNHKNIYDWDLCYQSEKFSVKCQQMYSPNWWSGKAQGQVHKLLVLCWECVVCITDQTKPFQRKYFKLANHGKPPHTQCNLKISEVKINLVNLQNLMCGGVCLPHLVGSLLSLAYTCPIHQKAPTES